ncbi:hypothetical protein DI458_17595 [Burkholderia contaminans]|nr:hypothetical protein [Burkholderia contaminans]MBA9837660.1 hypothetical protein [Burkholderia contaminans]MBA9861970.1 hypothetical protein [Burkholderia contaminans]MBA9904182.1 hypothetical protein [Burkholderia contaminans]MBA9932611.1 hypothetical protein [Burkholderia contaminans]
MAALTKYVDSGRRRLQRAGADNKNIARCGPDRAPGRMLTWWWRDGRCAGQDRRRRSEGAAGTESAGAREERRGRTRPGNGRRAPCTP